MKYYKLLLDGEYNEKYFQKGNIYPENYAPNDFFPISRIVERYPEDWELVEDEKTFPRVMKVWDDDSKHRYIRVVGGYFPKLEQPYLCYPGCKTMEDYNSYENLCSVFYEHAEEIDDKDTLKEKIQHIENELNNIKKQLK